jgi:hypothetical protein
VNRATQGRYSPGSALEPFSRILLEKSHPTTPEEFTRIYTELGFLDPPAMRIPLAGPEGMGENLHINPLQMALAAAALSSDGILPAPRIVLAANTPQEGWVILPALDSARRIFPSGASDKVVDSLTDSNLYWEYTGASKTNPVTWHLSGTLPGWKGLPIVITVLIEEDDPDLASSIAEALLSDSLSP